MNAKTLFGSRSRCRVRALMVSGIVTAFFALPVSGPSWAMEAVTLDHPSAVLNTAETSPLTSTEPTVADDPCRPLLSPIRQASPESAMDRDRHSAGQAAAVGLMLGIRFALGPKEVSGSNRSSIGLNIWQPSEAGNAHALAVSEYRRCKNEHALQSLRDLRWSR